MQSIFTIFQSTNQLIRSDICADSLLSNDGWNESMKTLNTRPHNRLIANKVLRSAAVLGVRTVRSSLLLSNLLSDTIFQVSVG